jgi:hypothetical protein
MMQGESVDGDEQSQPAAKRRRIGMACESCRARKARCDGAKPRCGNCVQRLERCLYRVTDTQLTEANEYVETLVGKVVELEDVVRQLRDASSKASASTHREGDSPRNTPVAQYATLSADERGSHPAPVRRVSDFQALHSEAMSAKQSLVNTSSPIDGMGGTSTVGNLSQADERFYGSSSATSFMRQLYDMATPDSSTGSVLQTGAIGISDTSTATPKANSKASMLSFRGFGDFSLLPRRLTDHLLHLYWGKVYHIYPFIHEGAFRSAYEQLWQPAAAHVEPQRASLGLGGSSKSGPDSSIFHCALNAMMTLGLQFSDFLLVEKVALTDTLVRRSRSHFSVDLFDDGSVELVQVLLLLTQVFQFTTVPTRCWSTIGGACRLSQGLGLHLVDNEENARQPEERELGKRIWHSCLMLDTIVSMTMGRPQGVVHNADFPLPNAMLPNEPRGAQGSSGERFSELSFFVEAVKMHKILAIILSQVYGQFEAKRQDLVSRRYGSFDGLVRIHDELTHFAAQVPAALNWSSEIGEHATPLLQQQRTILHARYLHLHVLLYRPTFTQFCKTYSRFRQKEDQGHLNALDFPPETSFAHIASITCAKRAMDLITQTHEQAATEATDAWWYNMYYARTAAMVVLMATLCPMVCNSIGRDILQSSWEHCRSILRDKLPQHGVVQKCLHSLEKLDEHIRRVANTEIHANSVGINAGAEIGQDWTSMNFDTGLGQIDDFWVDLLDPSAFDFALDDFGTSLL